VIDAMKELLSQYQRPAGTSSFIHRSTGEISNDQIAEFPFGGNSEHIKCLTIVDKFTHE